MLRKFAYLFLVVSLLTISNNVMASTEADVNLTPRTPTKKIQKFDEIYALEKRFVQKFADRKQKSPTPTRETLNRCFKEVTDSPTFKANYTSKEVEGHIFHIPLIALEKTSSQLDRLKEGKAYTSPAKGRALQGHHIQMRDPDLENGSTVDVWVITTTTHRSESKNLHIPTKKSQVTRSHFGSVQKRLYKEFAKEEINTDDESDAEPQSPTKKQKTKHNG